MAPLQELPAPSEPNGAVISQDDIPSFAHRGTGRISRLPKTVRDQVNHWILDGIPYAQIIQQLGEHGKDLTSGHLTEYKKRGYAEWLHGREWFEHVVSKFDFSQDLLTSSDVSSLHEAGLRMAAAQMIDQLMRCGVPTAPNAPLPEPDQFARLVNALSRLTREALAFQKYHDACAQARALLQEMKDPNRKLNENETRAIVLKVDNILGLNGEVEEQATKERN